ncbi:MAG: hypothetical protein V7704_01510 [Aurantimonas endophytica]|uniref:hypothetical protein n=1 Tax=Aurantimonas endophytica TaxID=1522175 RepID=UPI003002E548
MSDEDIARHHYAECLAADDELRDVPGYGMISIDDRLVESLRAALAGRATNEELGMLVGSTIERFRQRGNTSARPFTVSWRRLARALAAAKYEALSRVAERDEGDFSGRIESQMLQPVAEPEQTPTVHKVKFADLVEGYFKELAASGRGAAARRRWAPAFDSFTKFLTHDDASRVTRADVIEWKNDLLARLAPKTVRDSQLAAVKAVFSWGYDNGRIGSNPAHGVKVRLTARPQGRAKGFDDAEAQAILKAAWEYVPRKSDNPQTREAPQTTAAKRWIPWLCAFTGARVAEIAQIRREDVRESDGILYLRITPDAGSVKTGVYRDVPLHPQLIELGFVDFAHVAKKGPLFYRDGVRKVGAVHPSNQVAGRLSQWLRSLPVMPPDVDPSHGWRHRMKTISRELALDPRVVDAIQGHAARTAGENYGDVTLRAKAVAIGRLPAYPLR